MTEIQANKSEIRQYGIAYPGMITSTGFKEDLVAFFQAFRELFPNRKTEYPWVSRLEWAPIYGEDMLLLFEEAKKLRPRFGKVGVTSELLERLGISGRETKLPEGASDLAELFGRVFFVLSEEAPASVESQSTRPILKVFELGSVRICPVDPIIIGSRFSQLKSSEFTSEDEPLWLQDQIFDTRFYIGKI